MTILSRTHRLFARLVVSAIVMAAAGIERAAAADKAGELTIGGQTRTFSVHVPDTPPPRGGFPVVLAFHGGGMQGGGMERLSGLDTLADQRGLIVVYPDGIDRHWNDGRSTIKNPQDDVGFVSALLDRLQATYSVDHNRIFATGISNGALFAERLGCDLAQRISAIAPVAGTLPADISQSCRPARKIAVMQIDGTADPIMPFEGGKVADFGGRGEGGQVLSVMATANFWSRHDGCASPSPEMQLRPVAPFDPTRIVQISYAGCPSAGPVTVLIVNGGGHAWPGGPQYAPIALIGRASRQIDASRAIVDFFLRLPR